MQVKMRNIALVFLVLGMLFSCDSNRKYDAYISFGDSGWTKNHFANFEFDIQDTVSVNDLFINVRNNDAYEYNNLFLITKLKYPEGFSVIDTLEYAMADKEGNWLGHGFTDLKESKLIYKQGFVFSSSGMYTMTVEQAMRKRSEVSGIEVLKGITDIGFRIESVE